MTQNRFEAEISKSLREMNKDSRFYSGRFFDTKSFIHKTKYAIKQPADFWALWASRATLFELKSQKREPSFDTDKIARHQWDDLFRVEDTGNGAYFLLCRTSKPRNHECFAITPTDLFFLVSELNKKSVRWDLIKENSIEIFKVDGLWDLSVLFEGFDYY